MKHFKMHELEEAVAYSASGGTALHTHRFIGDRKAAPRCFVDAVERGEDIAHLFDMDELRLIGIARRLGVRIIVVERRGTNRQHIDLCCGPLRKALKEVNG
jgi:hypothetical protein